MTTHSLVGDCDGVGVIYTRQGALHHNIRSCGFDACGVEKVLGSSRCARLGVGGVFGRTFEDPHDQHHVKVHRSYEASLPYDLYDLSSEEKEEQLPKAFDHLTQVRPVSVQDRAPTQSHRCLCQLNQDAH